jgi:hypothetical protein
MSYLNTYDLELELDELEGTDADGDPLDDDDQERLTALRELRDALGSEWGEVTLIPHDEFEDYARDMAESIGAIDPSADSWPLTYIDWTAAAEGLATDYTSITFDGTDYYYKAV